MNAVAVPLELALAGELTIYSANDLRNLLVTALDQARDVRIDLGEVSDIDTAGLQLLLVARRELTQQGHRLLLQGHHSHLTDLLTLYQLLPDTPPDEP
jgi:anti-sigma B factor antagonist